MHTAIDDHTRLAYSEIHDDEKDATCAGFLHRAVAWFAAQGIRVRRVLTDNALVYRRGTDWGWVCSAWQLKRRFTKPGCPWTNGKAERFNRTLLNEMSGPTPATGPATACAAAALTDSCSTTTLDAATPPTAADHPSADARTSAEQRSRQELGSCGVRVPCDAGDCLRCRREHERSRWLYRPACRRPRALTVACQRDGTR